MITLLSIIVLGFFLGMRHATDPDHVIAVATIVNRNRSVKHAASIGALWGVGHTPTILLVGGGIILFGWVIPARLGLSMELSVGLMLILLGTLNLTGILEWITNNFTPTRHPHGVSRDHAHDYAAARLSNARTPGDCVHTHTHAHEHELHRRDPARTPLSWFDRRFGRLGLYNTIRPVAVGLVHGLAGSAAVALLVLTTIHDPKWSVAYLLLFGVGTIAGMMPITRAMAAPFAYAENRSRLSHSLSVASGLIRLSFGIFIVYQIVFVSGLLTAYPKWTPR
jgi:ABC-type nickel/cobalt efflux system permease component RcnA